MADPAWLSHLRLPPRTEPQPADDAGEDHLFCRPGMSLNPKYRRSGIKQLAIPRPRESLDLQGLRGQSLVFEAGIRRREDFSNLSLAQVAQLDHDLP